MPATGEIAGYFEVFAGCKLAGISEKKWPISITIKNRGKKERVKMIYCFAHGLDVF